VFGQKVREGQERRAVLDQTGHRLVVRGAVFADVAMEGSRGIGGVLGLVDRMQVLLGLGVL
jgi:hypothetical protein